MIQEGYCEEKLDASRSKGLKGYFLLRSCWMESRILCQKAFNKTYGFIARFPLARPQIHLSLSLELHRKFRLPFFPTNQECFVINN